MYELYEIEAMFECFARRREIQKVYDSTLERVHSFLEEMNKLERGSMTLGTFWKSKESTKKTLGRMKDKEMK